MRHLKPVEPPARGKRVRSRREIDEWVAERRRVLAALAADPGQVRPPRKRPAGQLELEDAA